MENTSTEGCTPNREDILQSPGPNFGMIVKWGGGTFYCTRDGMIELMLSMQEVYNKFDQKWWYNKKDEPAL